MKKEFEVVTPKVPTLKTPKKKKEDPQDVSLSDKEKSDSNKEVDKPDADLLTLEGMTTCLNILKAVAFIAWFCRLHFLNSAEEPLIWQ